LASLVAINHAAFALLLLSAAAAPSAAALTSPLQKLVAAVWSGALALTGLVDCLSLRDTDTYDLHGVLVHLGAVLVLCTLNGLGMLSDLKQQLPVYVTAAASAQAFDKGSVADYTDAILTWWRVNGGQFKAWALAARIVFAISPNSASCERVFALLKNLFGDQQMQSLADLVQAALMLNYNGRTVG